MWTPGSSADVVALKPFPAVFVAARHGPCQVSTWNLTPAMAGAVGVKVVLAVRSKVGVGEVVELPAKGAMATRRGMSCGDCSSITVTLPLMSLVT